jgi:hypothetical protein
VLGVDVGDHLGDGCILFLSLKLSDLYSRLLDGEWMVQVAWWWGGRCLTNWLLGVNDLLSVENLLGLLGILDHWLLFGHWSDLLALLLSGDGHWLHAELSELWSSKRWVLVLDGVDLGFPVLSWVLVALPEHKGVLILVPVVSHCQALLVSVNEMTVVQPDFLIKLSLFELSHGDHLALLHSLLSSIE